MSQHLIDRPELDAQGTIPLRKEDWIRVAHKRCLEITLATEEELDRRYPDRHALNNEIHSLMAVQAVCEMHGVAGKLDRATMKLFQESLNFQQAVDRLRLRLDPRGLRVPAPARELH